MNMRQFAVTIGWAALCLVGMQKSAWADEHDYLVADYTFHEGAGSIVHDVSGVEPVMHLTISDLDNVTWLDGALRIDGRRVLFSAEDRKILEACAETDEITIAAWVKPLGLNMSGPTRMVTFSDNAYARNFTLGTQNMDWVMRLRTTQTSDNGIPELASRTVETRISHIVYTRHASGDEFFYFNGDENSSGTRTGSFANWDAAHVFALGNEINPDDDRQFFGTYHRVSVYSKALTAGQVAALYRQGHQQRIPAPMIRANNRRGNLTVGWHEPVTITATATSGEYAGIDADWFVVAVPLGGATWYYLDADMRWTGFPADMLSACRPALGAPLMNVYNPVKIIDRYRFDPGTYYFYFVLDYPMNGVLDMRDNFHVYDRLRIDVR